MYIGPVDRKYLTIKTKQELVDIVLRFMNDKPSLLETCGVHIHLDRSLAPNEIVVTGAQVRMVDSTLER